MNELENRLGYCFRNGELLKTALTHSSYVNEHPGEHAECYERMEFLGDSILGAVTAEYLYRFEPALPEGKMTGIRAELVCEESLYRVAMALNLGESMRLGKGEERSSGRRRPSLLADMVEAVIAAIWLDGGPEPARRFIMTHVLQDAEEKVIRHRLDHKTELQELVQGVPGGSVRYQHLRAEGPDHNKLFTCAVYVNGRFAGEGSGHSKKEAEQAAAGAALAGLAAEGS